MTYIKNRAPRVYVVGGGFPYIKMFHSLGFQGARHVHEADIVCFTGGHDVNPELYGEKALKHTTFNRARDDYEIEAFAAVMGQKSDYGSKVCVGICRGAQFLNVMNGGTLWQHVDNHTKSHKLLDICYGEEFEVTSTHHQMMIPHERPETMLVAVANEATSKYAFGKEEIVVNKGDEKNDVEVIWYTDTLSLCFQPHPEMGHEPTYTYFSRLLDDWVIPIC